MKIFKLLLLFLPFLIVSSCKNGDEETSTNNEEIAQYLSSYTRGVITDNQDIVFVFNGNVEVDSSKVKSAVSIDPSINYTATFSQFNNSIKISSDQLEREQYYKVKMNLDKLIGKGGTVVSNLKVQGQYVAIAKRGLSIDKNGNQFLELEVTTAFAEKIDDLEKIFDINQDEITIAKVDATHYIAKIKYDGKGDMNIKWNAKDLKSKSKGDVQYSATNLKNFKVLSTFHDKKKNTLTAYFTQAIKPKQDLTGLIKSGDKNAKYSINGNKIVVKIQAQNSESADITFKKGIQSLRGAKTKKDYVFGVSLELIKPEIEWLADGRYIPSSGKFKVPFKAKGLKAVKIAIAAIPDDRAAQFIAWNSISNFDYYELIRYGDFVLEKDIDLTPYASDLQNWNEFGIDLSKSFKREPGYIYRVYLSFNPSQTILNCNDTELLEYESTTLQEKWFDSNSRYYDYYYNYNYKDRNNPCKTTFYADLSPQIKNVHCTNVFPIIKKGEKEITVAVKELETNKIASGAKVSLLNLQGQSVASQSTSGGGVVEFKDVKRDIKAVKIEYDGYITYAGLESGQENSYTEFDISSGVSSAGNELFVYSERDVRRPGDTIHLNVMLNDVDFDYPTGMPVRLRLYDPKGVLVTTETQAVKKDHRIYSFAIPTGLEAPTGYWNANINVGPMSTSQSVRVETIKPNVVDATFNLQGLEKGWIYNDVFDGTVNVQYLAGYAMKKGYVKVNANIYPVRRPFEEYKNYQFNKYDLDSNTDVEIFSGRTDNAGNVDVDSDIDFTELESVSRITLDTKIDLPGGGNNTMSNSFVVSPFSSYVGIEKVRGRGWRGSFRYGETPKIRMIHLDQKGKPSAGAVKIQVYKAETDWWYDRYRMSRNYSVRTSSYYELEKETEHFFNSTGEFIYTHDTNLGSGLFVIVAEDVQSGHIAEYKFHAVTTDDYEVKGNPIFIQLEMEKDNYNIGETMKVKLPEIKNAQALVSIEKGDQIIESFWMDLNNPRLEVKIKENYYPNFYLNVSIVQQYGSADNDRPMRMYTVEKIKVNQRAQVLKPEIIAPDKVEPNKEFTFKVKEKKGLPMEYTVAVVDRGLLNLTGFSTPDPLKYFSKQFPLLVKTWDIFSDLMFYFDPAYSGVISIGGDGAMKKMDESAGFNRFKPVVYHLGPFKIGKNGSQTHKINLPNYIGNLKVMVVAVNSKTFGNADKNIRVASPLMVQSQLPRALNISDEVTLPVTLFKDEKSIKNVDIKATNDNNAITFTAPNIDVNLGSEKQGLGELNFKVNEVAGKTTIGIDAKSGKYKSNEETSIFVNYPNSYKDKTTYYEIPKGGTDIIDINAFGYDKTKNVTLTLSGLILPDFSKYYSELIRYPHGCLEQTSSKAFCLLYTDKMIELSPSEKADAEQHLDAAFDRINRFQKSNGSFKYWDGDYYHPWADLYAGNFLLEAVENGKNVNQNVINNWIDYTSGIAESWSLSGVSNKYTVRYEEMLQAYRLFLLAKANVPEKSAMNRFRKRDLTPMAKVLLGGAYYYSGMKDVGQSLLDQGIANYQNNGYSYYTFGSDIRNRSIILMMLSIMNNGQSVDRYYKELVKDINNESWMSTQEKGWALMACRYYFKDKNAKGNQKVAFDLTSKTHSVTKEVKQNSYDNYYWNASQMGQQATIKNTGESNLFVVKNERAIPNDLYPAPENNNLSLDVKYTDLSGNPISLSDMEQGQEIKIIVNVRNQDIVEHKSLALAVKMPSGWELQNPRLLNTAQLKNSSYEYQDYRDDKVYTYFSLGKQKDKTYRFRAIANLKGNFYMPAVKVEHMYLGSVNASTEVSRVTIR